MHGDLKENMSYTIQILASPIDRYFPGPCRRKHGGAAIASNNISAYKIYYSLPWERVADYLGDVERGYLPGADTAGTLFGFIL